MDKSYRLALTSGSVAVALLLAACGGGGGSSAESEGGASSTVSSSSVSQSVSSAASSDGSTESSSLNASSSSEVSSSSEGNASSSTDSSSSASSVEQAFSRVTVSDAYVLEANVTIGGVPADIRLADGAYEWVEPQRGALVSTGGANDLAAPKNLATSDDPNAYPMAAPEGYEHINPFTTMIVLGGFDLNASYPAAAAYAGENGLPFNFDVVAAGSEDIQIAKETAKAALTIAQRYPAPPPAASSSSSAASVSSSSLSSSASASSTPPGSGGPIFPAASRSGDPLDTAFSEIDACTSQSCIEDVLLRTMMTLRGPYQPPCEPLPGEDGCTQGGGSAGGSSSSAVSSQTQSSSAPASSSSAVSSSSGYTGNPFPG